MNDMMPVAQVALGYAWQWVRAPKAVPNWIGYGAFGALAVGLWFWTTPTAANMVSTDWRSAVAQVVSMVLAVRGAASFSSDIKVAPRTDSK